MYGPQLTEVGLWSMNKSDWLKCDETSPTERKIAKNKVIAYILKKHRQWQPGALVRLLVSCIFPETTGSVFVLGPIPIFFETPCEYKLFASFSSLLLHASM